MKVLRVLWACVSIAYLDPLRRWLEERRHKRRLAELNRWICRKDRRAK